MNAAMALSFTSSLDMLHSRLFKSKGNNNSSNTRALTLASSYSPMVSYIVSLVSYILSPPLVS